MSNKTYPHIVLIGTESMQGKEIKFLLGRKNFPAANIAFCDPDVGEEYSKLTQFRDEPKVIRLLEEKCLDNADLVLLAADQRFNRKYGKLAAKRNIVSLDLCQSFTEGFKVPVVVAGINDGAVLKQKNFLIANPHPVSIMLAHFFKALESISGIKKAVVFVLQPVSAYAEQGIEELAKQSVNMLSSTSSKRKVFKSQIAFNVLSQIEEVDESGFSPVEKQIEREIKQVLDKKDLPFSLSLVQAPVFHSYSLMVYFELKSRTELLSLEKLFKRSRRFKFSRPSPSNPVSAVAAAGKEKICIGQIKQDQAFSGNFWLWMAADNLTCCSALNAYEVADKI